MVECVTSILERKCLASKWIIPLGSFPLYVLRAYISPIALAPGRVGSSRTALSAVGRHQLPGCLL